MVVVVVFVNLTQLQSSEKREPPFREDLITRTASRQVCGVFSRLMMGVGGPRSVGWCHPWAGGVPGQYMKAG